MRWATLLAAVMSGVLVSAGSSLAQQSVTVKGVTYAGAELIKEFPLSVFISHAAGKTFINKADLSDEDSQALGVTRPVADGFQQALDKDLHDLQAAKRYDSATPPPAARQDPAKAPPISKQASRLGITPEALQASRGMDARGQWAMLGAVTGVNPRKSTAAEDRRMELPKQRYMRPSDASTVRLAMFSEGLLPLKESEARDLFDGREISPLSSRCALDAFKAAKVMLGQLGPKHLPREYRALSRRGGPFAARASASTDRRSTPAPFDSSMFATPNAISAAPSAPKFVNSYDSAGNFHTGVVQPTGAYSGTVHSPMGDVGHVNGHVSPIGSFQGTDNHGGFYHGH